MAQKSDIEKTASPSDRNYVTVGLLLFIIAVWCSIVFFGPKLYDLYKEDQAKTQQVKKTETVNIPVGSTIQFTKPNGESIEGIVKKAKILNDAQVEITFDDGKTYIVPINSIYVSLN